MSNTLSVALERTGPLGVVQSCVRPSRFPFVIGRGPDCDLRLFDPALSRRHCVLDLHDGRLLVEDLNSRNGTEVNGERVSQPRPLADGDMLWVGGSVFTVRFHVGVADAVAHRRVLLVEDNADTAEILDALLRLWGHDVEVAGDSIQSVEVAREYSPDAVLLDLDLGDGSDGREIAHQLRREPCTCNARVLALTGRPTMPADAAFDGMLFKPVDPSALREALAAGNAGRPGHEPGRIL